jgi:hypothetical protein
MLIPGLSNKDAEGVFVGTTAAAEVYLGTVKVWPTPAGVTPGVMGEMLIVNPTNNQYTGTDQRVSIPAAATAFDVVMIGGGGGGGDGGTLGPGEGGGCGTWATATYTVGTDYPAGHVLQLFVGSGGEGGQALLNTGGKPGIIVSLMATDGTTVKLSSAGGSANSMPDRTGATPPDCVFNGRTYKGGIGGTSSNQNGVNGAAPGGGGQGGNDEVTGNNGGKGGSGGIYLYFY